MKIRSLTAALILLCAGLVASAQDVFMATSEDLKEFDNLISKEKAPPLQPPPANGSNPAANNIKKRSNGQRDRFQGNRPAGEQGGPHGFPPPQQQPPSGTEPGGNGRPPPPPPPQR